MSQREKTACGSRVGEVDSQLVKTHHIVIMRTEQIFNEKSLLVQSLKIANNLDRKKSLSTSVIPTQNKNYLCVPLLHNGLQHPKSVDLEGNHGFPDIVVHTEVATSYQSMTRSISQSTLTIPENYSFTSVQIKVYKRRWVMLVLGMMSIVISYVQWIQYSIVANIIVRYYDISSTWVDWTSMIFMVVYVLCVFPISYMMDIRNLRQTAVIGSVGTAIGAWIKVFSADRDQFQLVLVGQTVSAISQVFLMSIPSRLASTWFAPEEASSVCAFGVFAAQLGIAAGFFFTPIVILNHDDLTQTGVELKIFLMAVAGISTVIACMVIAVFKSAPQFAPSHVQALQRTMKMKKEDYWPAVGRLLQHDNFLILVIAYGINVGIFNAFSTLLNQIVVNYFPKGEADAGRIGLGLIVLGLVGSMVFGYLLDTMHKYKATAIWACRLSALTLVIFALALESRSKKLVSVASIFLG